jgi:phosphatidate cytidylyltransferase
MKNELLKRILSSIFLIPLIIFLILEGSFVFIFFIIICFFITSYEWLNMSKKKSYSILGVFFLIFSFYSIYKLRINTYDDYLYLFFVITVCISTDIGGYFFGKTLKGPKLTKISPNKTYAGMIGSFLFSIIFSIIFINIVLDENLYLNWLILIILLSSISQSGDIIISYFKRVSKIKDTGKIIPGHGGLLDRIDGMIFVFPVAYIFFLIDFI